MSKEQKNVAQTIPMTSIEIKVDTHCVVNITRASSNPDKPLQRQYQLVPGDHFRITTSNAPVSLSFVPCELLPDSIKV